MRVSPALHPPERPPHTSYTPARACFAACLTEAAGGNEVEIDRPDFFAMSCSLPSVIGDALDTLYEPNAVFTQFPGSASMTFFSSFAFIVSASLSCRFLVFLSLLLSPFLLRFFALLFFRSFIFLSFLCFLFSNLLASAVHMRSTSERYHVQYIRTW